MNWIRYSIGNTRAFNTMPLSIGAPVVHAPGASPVSTGAVQVRLGYQIGILKEPKLLGSGL